MRHFKFLLIEACMSFQLDLISAKKIGVGANKLFNGSTAYSRLFAFSQFQLWNWRTQVRTLHWIFDEILTLISSFFDLSHVTKYLFGFSPIMYFVHFVRVGELKLIVWCSKFNPVLETVNDNDKLGIHKILRYL